LFPTAGTLPISGRLFAVGAAAYTITYTPSQPVAGQDVQIDVRDAGTNIPAGGTLFYRVAGETAYQSTSYAPGATIPASVVR
jgi:hypothetical protein